jgi:hypothetical protein
MRGPVILLLLAAAGCGRIGYDYVSTNTDDGGLDDAGESGVDARVLPLECTGTSDPLVNPKEDSSLVGFWSFNDGVATDFSLSARNGTVTGAASTPGAIGLGMSFDGVNDSVSMDDVGDVFDIGNGELTIEAWVNTTDDCSTQKVFLARYTSTVGWNLSCLPGGFGGTRFRDSDGVFVAADSTTTVITDGAWHHLAGVKRGGQLEFYVDGVLEAMSPTAFTGVFDTDVPVTIGHHGADNRHINAIIDEVRVWKRALPAADIAGIVATMRPGLAAYWDFDDLTTAFAGLPFPIVATGDVSPGVGRSGAAASFGGTDGKLEIAMPDLFSTTYTAKVWFRTVGTGGSQILMTREEPPRGPVHLHVQEANLRTNVRGDSGGGVGTTYDMDLTDDCWHQAAVVRIGGDGQAGEVRLYADGQRVSTVMGTFDQTAVTVAPLTIGYRFMSDPRAFLGEIDEVQIYERALTDTEIAASYDVLK